MKKRLFLIIVLIILVVFFSGITYSFFNSGVFLKSTNQGIASFIFETNNVDYINFNLSDLLPGDEKEYLFSVTNSKDKKISDVTVEYQLRIKTYHFIPLTISLYKIDGEQENLVGNCDETSSRNSKNELVCNMPINKFEKGTEKLDNYKLKIVFPEEYNDATYSGLVDYIKIELDSWQKI